MGSNCCEGVVIVHLEWLIAASTGLQYIEQGNKTQNWSKRVLVV
jgi:hypothetical protein